MQNSPPGRHFIFCSAKSPVVSPICHAPFTWGVLVHTPVERSSGPRAGTS